MNTKRFFQQLLLPTVVDFREDNRSYRKAILAAILVYHLPEHVFVDRHADDESARKAEAEYRKSLQSERWYKAINQLANAAKHGRRRKSGYDLSQGWYAPPARAGVMMAGRSFIGDGDGGVVARTDMNERVYMKIEYSIEAALTRYAQDFPELR